MAGMTPEIRNFGGRQAEACVLGWRRGPTRSENPFFLPLWSHCNQRRFLTSPCLTQQSPHLSGCQAYVHRPYVVCMGSAR